MRERLAAFFKKACDFSNLPGDSPACSPHRFLDFPSLQVFFDNKGGFFPALPAPTVVARQHKRSAMMLSATSLNQEARTASSPPTPAPQIR
jgi:hypothetical protein